MIYDTNDNQILSASFAIVSTDNEIITIRVDCKTANYLTTNGVSDIAVEARLVGAGSWTNLETTPIDLTSYNGTKQDFEIRLTAGTITSFLRKLIPIAVGRIEAPNPPNSIVATNLTGGDFRLNWEQSSWLAITGYQSKIDELLGDKFENGTTINAIWTVGQNVTQSSGKLILDPGATSADYSWIYTAQIYGFQNSYAEFEIESVCTGTDVVNEITVGGNNGTNNSKLWIDIKNGNLECYHEINGVSGAMVSSAWDNATKIKFSNDAGLLKIETYLSGTWTTRLSVAESDFFFNDPVFYYDAAVYPDATTAVGTLSIKAFNTTVVKTAGSPSATFTGEETTISGSPHTSYIYYIRTVNALGAISDWGGGAQIDLGA